jgi:hypothetical protein
MAGPRAKPLVSRPATKYFVSVLILNLVKNFNEANDNSFAVSWVVDDELGNRASTSQHHAKYRKEAGQVCSWSI